MQPLQYDLRSPGKKTVVLRMQPRRPATLTQPFHWDLQPQIQETHRTTHTGTLLVAEHRGGTNSRQKRPQPQPPHTRGAFHRRLQPLYTEKCTVSCSGFLPKTKPIEHSCSHYYAFCSITWQTCISLHTWQQQMTTIMQPFQCDLQPQIQETNRTTHIDTTTQCRTQRRNPFATETTPAAPTEKYKVSCSGFLPKT